MTVNSGQGGEGAGRAPWLLGSGPNASLSQEPSKCFPTNKQEGERFLNSDSK